VPNVEYLTLLLVEVAKVVVAQIAKSGIELSKKHRKNHPRNPNVEGGKSDS